MPYWWVLCRVALPCLIGWAAGEAELSMGGWILFGIQFLWQFPHFWAIAWVAHTDYTTAGFKLLPADKGPTKFTALQTVIYSLLLVPVTLIPYFTGMCSYDDVKGVIGIALVLAANVFMVMRCLKLYQKYGSKCSKEGNVWKLYVFAGCIAGISNE